MKIQLIYNTAVQQWQKQIFNTYNKEELIIHPRASQVSSLQFNNLQRAFHNSNETK